MTRMMQTLRFATAAATVAVLLAAAASEINRAAAAEITGAGATFPYPIYAKWAEAYKKQTGIAMNYT